MDGPGDGFQQLTRNGRPGFDPEVALTVRRFNEEAVATLGKKFSKHDLGEFLFPRFQAQGVFRKIVARAQTEGSRPLKEVPPRYRLSKEPGKDDSGVMAMAPPRTYRFPCEEIFFFCAGARKLTLHQFPPGPLQECNDTHTRLMKTPVYSEKFLNILRPLYQKAETLDVTSSKEMGDWMSSFLAAFEEQGLAATLEAEAATLKKPPPQIRK